MDKRDNNNNSNNNNKVDVQFGKHTQSSANCIPPAELALNLAVGDFERNGEIGGRDVGHVLWGFPLPTFIYSIYIVSGNAPFGLLIILPVARL